MQINADLTQRAVVESETLDWAPSPLPGVERRMLERDGDEVARATSIVRYAPNSHFPPHEHGLGEEYIVLDGVFSDEHGDCGPGTYVRNPPGSAHQPRSDEGCTILVKLRQMAPDNDTHVVIDTNAGRWQEAGVPGLTFLPLYEDTSERVALVRFAPGTRVPHHVHEGGEELFVLEGALSDQYGTYPAGTWVRQPHGSSHEIDCPDGCLVYVKAGHLPR